MNPRPLLLVAVVLGAALAGAPSASAAISFAPGTATNVDTFTVDHAVGEVTGDSHADVVLTHHNNTPASAAILAGAGDGTYATVGDYAAAPVGRVALGDMNGDGRLDLVSGTNEGSTGRLRIALGDDAGGFTPHSATNVGTNVNVVEVADVNGDGLLDVIAGTAFSGGSFSPTVFRILGDGAGGFGARTTHSVATSTIGVAIGDVDGDSDLDIVTAGTGSRPQLLRNNGTGGLTLSTIDVGPEESRYAALGDLDGDGDPDLAVTNANSGSFTVALNDGGGNFGGAVTHGGLSFPTGIGIADLDNDGDRDVAMLAGFGVSGGGLRTYANNGAGGLTVASTTTTGRPLGERLILHDADEDGRTDALARASNPTGGLLPILNTTPPNQAPAVTGVTLSPAVVRTNSTVSATPSGSDPDANPLTFTYQWQRRAAGGDDFEDLAGQTASTLDLSAAGNGDKGDAVRVVVTASDGSLSSTPFTSAAKTIDDTKPVIASVSITPGAPRTDSVLEADGQGVEDADGDPVTLDYAWTRNGTGIAGQSGATLDLAEPGHGDKGDELTVAATPVADGAEGDPATSAPVTVQNSPPQVSAGEEAYAGTEGSPVALAGTATDADGDTLALGWQAHQGPDVDAGTGCDFSNATLTALVTCTDDGSFELELTADDGEAPVSDRQDLALANADPEIGAIAISGAGGTACRAGGQFGAAFSVTDPGANDTLSGTTDWGDGSAPTPFSGAAFSGQHTYAPGSYVIDVSAEDDDGGTDERSTPTGAIALLFERSGFGAPLGAGGTRSSFKLGSTVPLKIEITDCDGAVVSNLNPRVALEKVAPAPASPVGQVASSSAADDTDRMRFEGSRYVYNLSTKRSQFCDTADPMCAGPDLTPGTYRLSVTDPSFAPLEVLVDLR